MQLRLIGGDNLHANIIEGVATRTRIATSAVRVLSAIALPIVVAAPVALVAQQLTVTSAVIRWVPRGVPGPTDTARAVVVVQIGGLPAEQLRAVKLHDLVITDSHGRDYAAELVGRASPDSTGVENVKDRRYVFTVPQGEASFELRLQDFRPVPFIGTVSMAPGMRRRGGAEPDGGHGIGRGGDGAGRGFGGGAGTTSSGRNRTDRADAEDRERIWSPIPTRIARRSRKRPFLGSLLYVGQ